MLRPWLPLLICCSLGWCKPAAPTSYPDHDKVVAAQNKWCAALAALAGDRWHHQKECAAAYPTGSAVFVAQMADCYQEQIEALGDQAPDSAAVLGLCSDQILTGADPGEVGGTPVVQARCSRMERCQQVARDQCMAAFESLDGTQRATLTSMYNLRAQAAIASCLEEGECSENEDEARAECYREPFDQRVWLPLSLAHDPSVAPVPSD